MTETKQGSFPERLVRRLRWFAWAWAALAVVWLVLAIVEPSGFHTFMAIAWAILAAAHVRIASYARRQKRTRAQDACQDSGPR